ncbi:MAG: WHG domain-containing protein, partial [Actinomycetes bacterium]
THAAPRRYFPDRQSLLDAVAAEGFARLGSRLREAAAAAPGYREQVRAVAAAYVDFTVAEANLVELMFAHQRGTEERAVAQSAADAFAPLLEVFRRARDEGLLTAQEPEQVALIFLATLQGITGLTSCGVIPVEQLDELVEAAVARFDLRQG